MSFRIGLNMRLHARRRYSVGILLTRLNAAQERRNVARLKQKQWSAKVGSFNTGFENPVLDKFSPIFTRSMRLSESRWHAD